MRLTDHLIEPIHRRYPPSARGTTTDDLGVWGETRPSPRPPKGGWLAQHRPESGARGQGQGAHGLDARPVHGPDGEGRSGL